jgi:hypothetical protein
MRVRSLYNLVPILHSIMQILKAPSSATLFEGVTHFFKYALLLVRNKKVRRGAKEKGHFVKFLLVYLSASQVK